MSNVSEPFGCTLLVNKPLTWTSFDVVNKLRYAAKTITGRKKIKVGHAGTLDPLATGLVIVCVGRHTKTINELMGMEKCYEGTFRLGGTTPSYDLETDVDQHYPIPPLDPDRLQEVAASFMGEIDQVPPLFSAKKIDGKKAYEIARAGKSAEMKASRVRITRFDLQWEAYPDIDFELECSKGTYVRSLAHDFGQRMDSGAHLTRLHRTRVGAFSITDAFDIEGAIKALEVEYHKYLKANTIS